MTPARPNPPELPELRLIQCRDQPDELWTGISRFARTWKSATLTAEDAAAELVLRWNAHAALVAACDLVLDRLTDGRPSMSRAEMEQSADVLREAIRLARGEEAGR